MGIAYNPKIVTNGLALCVDAANQKSYPGSGTTLTDLSGSGNTGTLVNGVVFSGNNKGIQTFDGNNDFSQMLNRTMPATLYPFSYNIWFNVSRIHTVSQAVLSVLDSSSSSRYWCLAILNDTNELFVTRRNTSTVSTTLGYIISVGEWYSAHVNFNNTTSVEVFVNGESIFNSTALTAVASSTAANDVLLGVLRTSSPTWYLQGSLGPANLYNRILSAQEIQQNFNATRGRYGI
jgi:hypothetical protein